MFQWPGSGDYFHMLHHKHFDCNYGAMHVPLDYLFGTYAGSKQEVRPGWREEGGDLYMSCAGVTDMGQQALGRGGQRHPCTPGQQQAGQGGVASSSTPRFLTSTSNIS